MLALLVWWLGRRKAKVDAADKLVEIAMKLVKPVSESLDRVSADLEAHKAADEAGKAARQVNSRLHMQWDQTVAEKLRENGIHVDDPPPLYEGGGHELT